MHDYPPRPATPGDGTIVAEPFIWVDPKTLPRRQWLYAPHYIRGFLSLTLAAGGTSKSTLTMTEAVAMASGRPLLGVKVKKPLRVWYFNLEDPQEELDRRVAAICKHFDVKQGEIGDRLFINSGRKTPLIIAEDGRNGASLKDQVVQQITEQINAKQIDVMIVDPFVASHLVPENDNSKVNLVVRAWSEIAEAANCSMMMVHHTRKLSGQPGTAEDGRGASALVAAARSVRNLNTMEEKEAEAAGIDPAERRSYFRADIGKSNLTAPAESADWYKRVSVNLENCQGVDWDQGDNVGVVEAFNYPKLDALVVTPTQRERLLLMVDEGRWRASSQSRDWVGRALAQVLDIDIDNKLAKRRVNKLLAAWFAGGLLALAERPDEHRDMRKFVIRGPVAAPDASAAGGAAV